MAKCLDKETTGGFYARRVATSGCEILDPTGQVIAWTVDEFWAMMIAKMLMTRLLVACRIQ